MDREVAALVLGRALDRQHLQPGILHGFERLVVAEESYPALALRAGGKVSGLVVEPISETDLARMQFFESEEFAPADCRIELVSGGFVSAQTFLAREALTYTDQPWSFEHWQQHEKRDYLLLVREWMREYGKRESHQLEAAWSEARREQLARRDDPDGQSEQQTTGGKS